MAGEYTLVDDGLVDALLEILQDPNESEELRGKAAIAFGPAFQQMDELMEPTDAEEPLISEAKFREAQRILRAIYEDPSVPRLVRRKVLEASVRAHEPWHEGAVRAAYVSGDPEWKLTAVFCMQYVPGFEAEILESLDDPDPLVRMHAIEAAGVWKIPGVWDRISDLASSSKTPKNLRLAAIEALSNCSDPECLDVLERLSHSKDREIAEAAEEALSYAFAEQEAEDSLEEDSDEEEEDFGEGDEDEGDEDED